MRKEDHTIVDKSSILDLDAAYHKNRTINTIQDKTRTHIYTAREREREREREGERGGGENLQK